MMTLQRIQHYVQKYCFSPWMERNYDRAWNVHPPRRPCVETDISARDGESRRESLREPQCERMSHPTRSERKQKGQVSQSKRGGDD